ncbi:MAG: TrkA family potassium uptake protein, partial [Chloroflexota bacterium]|nr:TrkA family potassium uptake protein [Chloroflexota bacterium]
PLGCALTDIALQENHNVVLIEEDEQRAKEASRAFDAMVLNASITKGDILEEANARRADALIAVTRDDAANLMAVVLAQQYDIELVISIVSDPKHEQLFQNFDCEVLVGPERFIAQKLYELLRHPIVEDVIPLQEDAQISYLILSESSPLVGRRVAEVAQVERLQDVIIVSLNRDGQSQRPSANTTLRAGDRLTVFSPCELDDEELALFTE